MKKLMKSLFLGALYVFAIASPVMALASPQAVSAANCEQSFLGIPPWYRGLTEEKDGDCVIVSPDDVGGISNFIWRIVLNGIQMAVSLLAYVTVFFVIYGGFLYLTGGAVPAQLEKAKKTLLNAVIGLVICLSAIALTNLVFSIIT